MSYTALYRKFRPQEFEDVKGQEHIVTTFKNQIKAERIGHAYLFCGTRGTGKTTVAKIFAKAVNCENPQDGSPCNECPTCRGINEGTSMNVIEIDAASNNSVDNIRQIREEVEYRPTEGKFKVYIIDEVHMLSTGAFNALLKTLEEPPAYVIFILATTESHKIPITILSRCQRYDFRRISIDTIAGRLADLMEKENIKAEEKALRYVAKSADGSMRDALSLLDQCIAFHLGETLTYENVLDVLGAADTEVFSELLRAVLTADIQKSVRVINRMVEEGRELGQFVEDFIWYLRNLLLLQTSDDMEEVLEISKDNLVNLKEEANMVETDVLIRYIRIFSELKNQIRYVNQKRIYIEIAIIKLAKPQMEKDYAALLQRIEILEKQMESGVVTRVESNHTEVSQAKPIEKPPIPKAIGEDIQTIIRNWKAIISETSGVTRNYLNKAIPSLGNNQELLLVFDDANAYAYLNEDKSNSITLLKERIAERINKEVEITLKKNESGHDAKDIVVDLRDLIQFDITEEAFE